MSMAQGQRRRVEPRRVTPLKLAIVASGLTITEVAKRIEVDASVLSRWCGAPADGEPRVPKVTHALALARELGTTVDALFPQEDIAA